MAKVYSNYICQQCGNEESKWHGKCPNCGEWGSLVETPVSFKRGSKKSRVGRSSRAGRARPLKLSSVTIKSTKRISTKIPELDRVLGGGLVPGQVVLLAGEPGIGKSTILLQLAEKLGNFLYVTGEESIGQVKVRAVRLGVKKQTIEVLEETDVDEIIGSIEAKDPNKLACIAIDSIQAVSTKDLSGMAGSIGQVRESAFRLTNLAKRIGIPLFIAGQVTKEGTVAGPAALAHLVDTVLWFEGDKNMTLRLLRAHKNRFGATDEVGIFEMADKGLVSVANPEKLFLTKHRKVSPGSVISSIMQGTRPIMVEVQSLVVPGKLAYPKRVAQGIDSRRLELLLAVLIKRVGIPLYESDVFVNIAGGITVREPSTDLAICLSIASAYFDKPLPRGTVAIGEVGLLGDIREVVAQEKRVKEARRLGYRTIITQKEEKYLNQAIRRHLK